MLRAYLRTTLSDYPRLNEDIDTIASDLAGEVSILVCEAVNSTCPPGDGRVAANAFEVRREPPSLSSSWHAHPISLELRLDTNHGRRGAAERSAICDRLYASVNAWLRRHPRGRRALQELKNGIQILVILEDSSGATPSLMSDDPYTWN